MRQLPLGCSLLWSVLCCGVAGPVWAQEPTPVVPAPVVSSPGSAAAPTVVSRPPAPAPVAVLEPGSALASLLGASSPSPSEPSARMATPTDERPTRSGFVVGASLGLNLVLATGQTTPQPGLQPGLALGAKLDRVVLTVGAEYVNLSTSATMITRAGVLSSSSQSNSLFLVVPGMQVALVRSHDGRVELLGAARVGFGAPVNTMSQNPAVPAQSTTVSTSQFNFMYEIGPGVRYWPHRHFALNLLAGFRGDYLFQSTTGTFPADPSVTSLTRDSSNGLNGIFASIGGMGAF